ncbi:MAG: glycine--tRNA ligase [Micavibrio aeruginosavorus]|uniref:glycine--tRNA ligase n=1 Tax=Micavibrio aeruginosavorus TaxID=349221 RepID=A0A2W5HFI2_9BACT|nr:MAG: glycine--tRNA ligase [Micavibrio aeruginosavorus]
MKDIVALCKRRGFIFQASEIYGGINGFWDYGPLGVELKNNVRDLWWKSMVTCPPIGPDGLPVDIVGLDSAIIQNPEVWVASGHVGGFTDPMVDCKETKKRYREDHLVVYITDSVWPAFHQETEIFDIDKRLRKLGIKEPRDVLQAKNLTAIPLEDYKKIVGPDAKEAGTLTEPKAFNLLFESKTGATQDQTVYLRGETAQGIFINYKNVLDSSRVRVPFGIAQIGKAFRNEVNPRNFIFRSREFEQMEMEWFCHPSEAKMWFDFWVEQRKIWWEKIGLKSDDILMRPHDADELVFYSQQTYDIEYRFPFTSPGFGELEGIAYRTDYDLTQHQTHSKTKLEYMDPITNEKFMPHVIEPAAGLTRGVLALLCEAYTVDPNRPSGMYMNFHPALAPKKAAILPLTAKDEHPVIATKLYLELRNEFAVDLDIKQNIGKRYARQDEIGTPYCFTIDNDTVSDGTVTVRERNTMAQERISLDNVAEYLRKNIKAI